MISSGSTRSAIPTGGPSVDRTANRPFRIGLILQRKIPINFCYLWYDNCPAQEIEEFKEAVTGQNA